MFYLSQLYYVIVPSASPSSVSVRDVAAFTVTVQWEMVPCTAQNGEIISHIVYYWETESENQSSFMAINITVNGTNRSVCLGIYAPGLISTTQSTLSGEDIVASNHQVTLTGLRRSTRYTIAVAAYNRAGIGKQSQPLLLETNSEFL